MDYDKMTYMEILKVRNDANRALDAYSSREEKRAFSFKCDAYESELYFANAREAIDHLIWDFKNETVEDLDEYGDFTITIKPIYLTESEYDKWIISE